MIRLTPLCHFFVVCLAGSCLVLAGNGADVAMHCIPPVKRRRISITLRRYASTLHVCMSDPHLVCILNAMLALSTSARCLPHETMTCFVCDTLQTHRAAANMGCVSVGIFNFTVMSLAQRSHGPAHVILFWCRCLLFPSVRLPSKA